MRIKAPGGGSSPPIDGVGETTGTGPTAPASQVGGTAATVGTGAAAPVAPSPDLVADVARRLRSGELSARDAVELLIDDAVDRQVGRLTSDRLDVAGELKDLLRRYTESDPYLASKVRRLGNKP